MAGTASSELSPETVLPFSSSSPAAPPNIDVSTTSMLAPSTAYQARGAIGDAGQTVNRRAQAPTLPVLANMTRAGSLRAPANSPLLSQGSSAEVIGAAPLPDTNASTTPSARAATAAGPTALAEGSPDTEKVAAGNGGGSQEQPIGPPSISRPLEAEPAPEASALGTSALNRAPSSEIQEGATSRGNPLYMLFTAGL